MLKLETKEAERLLIPTGSFRPASSIAGAVDKLLRSGDIIEAVSLVDAEISEQRLLDNDTLSLAKKALTSLLSRRQKRME